MSGFGVPGSDAVWNPYQGSPGANAEASYSFGQYGDYAQGARPFPSAPAAMLNQQQAGIFRAFSGYGQLPAMTGPAFGALHALVAWWAWKNRRAAKPAFPMYLIAAVSAVNALTLFGVNVVPKWGPQSA